MPIEFEAKFLNISRDALRARLQACGFACSQPDMLMRRVVFNLPTGSVHEWARVRDESGAVTITYKKTVDSLRVDGTQEIQITANNFDDACALLAAFGLVSKSYQETRREIWRYGALEATIDEWPALAPFCEIEGPDEASVRDCAHALGFEWADALFGAVDTAYATIGISATAINSASRITFDNVEEVLALQSR